MTSPSTAPHRPEPLDLTRNDKEIDFDPLSHLDMSSTTPLSSQVAGHRGVMSDESGSLVIKPALPKEAAFYQLVAESSRSSPLSKLRPFLAQFYGTLRLEGRLSSSGQLDRDIPEPSNLPPHHLESIVLENVAHPFISPSILDIKLGTTLHAPDASPEKAARMAAKAEASTSGKTGLRLTGSRTWHMRSGEYIVTGRDYGYGLTVERLGEGLARFFPLPNDEVVDLEAGGIPTTIGFGIEKGSNSPSGITSTTTTTTTTTITTTCDPIPETPNTQSTSTPADPAQRKPKIYTNHAIPPSQLIKILDILLSQLDVLTSALSLLEMRFVGSSLLIVYESNPDRLADSIAQYEARRVRDMARSLAQNRRTQDGDREYDDEDDDSELDDEDSADESEDEDDYDEYNEHDEDEKERIRLSKKCPPVIVRMIDFAHTYIAHEEGPDQGVLLGIQTLKRLVQRRRDEAEALVNDSASLSTKSERISDIITQV